MRITPDTRKLGLKILADPLEAAGPVGAGDLNSRIESNLDKVLLMVASVSTGAVVRIFWVQSKVL